MKKTIYILFLASVGALLSICISCKSSFADKLPFGKESGNCLHIGSMCYTSDNTAQFGDNGGYAELMVADVSHSGSIASNLRVMVKFTSRQIYQTSVFWAKDAVRRIAEYMQHQSFITESLNSSKFRTGMTGYHIQYIYLLCRMII